MLLLKSSSLLIKMLTKFLKAYIVVNAIQAAIANAYNESNPANAAPGPPPGLFDFYFLALSWPPAAVPISAHSRARHIMHQGEANAGFWTHGLWPQRLDGVKSEYCSAEIFKPDNLGVFENSLMYYMRLAFPSTQPEMMHLFWGHEWSKHGTCSNLDQLSYFMKAFQASMKNGLKDIMAAGGITPSNTKQYTVAQVQAPIIAKFGPAFHPTRSLLCIAPGGVSEVAEIRLCLDKTASKPIDCSLMKADNEVHVGRSETMEERWGVNPFTGYRALHGSAATDDPVPCPTEPKALVYFRDFQDPPGNSIPWGVIFVMGTISLIMLGLLVYGWQVMEKWRLLPPLFVPQPVHVVHYDQVQLPVEVLCEPLDMEWMWSAVPVYAEFVSDLPVGMGIKGGIARKLLKEMYGVPEPPGSFDIDVLLFVDVYSVEKRRAAREIVTGMKLGGLVLEPQDVEVLSKQWLTEYFITRDVTMNEVLILKVAPTTTLFLYTRDALRDVQANIIRPSVHCLSSEFALAWEIEDNGTPYAAPQQICRSLVRYLKGHGSDYAFDAATWAHYRRVKLTKTQLFKVLKPFHDSDEKMLGAVDHLVSIGFLSREEVRKAGGVNLFWGLLLQEINTVVSKNGSRMILKELDPDAVERWVEMKQASVAAKIISMEMRAHRTGFAPSEENVIDLGRLSFPPALLEYIRTGPTFDPQSHMAQTANSLVQNLSASRISVIENYKVLKSEAAKGGEAVLKIAAQATASAAGHKNITGRDGAKMVAKVTTGPAVSSGAAGQDGSFTGSEDPALKRELDAEIAKLRGLLTVPASNADSTPSRSTQSGPPMPSSLNKGVGAANGASEATDSPKGRNGALISGSANDRLVSDIRTLTRESNKRHNKEYMGSFARGSLGGPSIPEGQSPVSGSESGLFPPAVPAGSSKSSEPAGGSWIRHSELKEKMQAVATLPGTFYQVVPIGEAGEDPEYVPLVTGKDMPERKRLNVWQLARFLAGVMAMQKNLLLAAYSLMLLALLFRLCLPRVEAAIFDAFNDLDTDLFKTQIRLWMAFVGADVMLSLLGGITLEQFSRMAMQTLFRRFFEHVVFQDLPFFDRLSPGELMARTSGDSLTVRSIVSSTCYQMFEGSVLFLGSIVMLLYGAGPLLLQQPGILIIFLLVVALNFLIAWALGQWLRKCNLAVRQALGRMFGFTLDAFSKIETVASLGLEPRMLKDYRSYSKDYFRQTFMMNVSLYFSKAFTTALSASLLAGLMWFGGGALFSDLTTVGNLFGLLRYVHWMQKGMKQASSSYARIMAGLGSVERIVELHDRGVIGKVPGDQDLTATDEDTDTHRAGRAGLFKTLSINAHTDLSQPLLSRTRSGRKDLESARPLAPPPDRPDFSHLLGGFRLQDVQLAKRSKTDRLLLDKSSMEIVSGDLAVITGEEFESKSSLLSLILVRMTPFQGHVAFQLPDAAIPAASHLLTVHNRPGWSIPGMPEEQHEESLMVVQAGGPGWKWATFSFRKDNPLLVRSLVGYVSVGCCGIFRTTVEDNIAVATTREVTSAEVREVCRKVGAHETFLQLPDGYATLVGEGSGHPLTQQTALRIGLARALIRRPRILLLDNGDQLAEAVGPQRLADVLQEVCQEGCCVVICSNEPQMFPSAKTYKLSEGRLHLSS
ncbi:hypothetical protein CEUSTIGMA_g12124.t1 [Chlamydomonas eustigma]|uniref:ABC transmembrane type-1 domain-containing protein n=1 Tax=Chlamydomonas eustigma TaxID=1157962 RepID=A0A250XP45_9CHLO|nr:hypothetical protein CEUSTIGMA_g12124.t1 [Chlamydomonas eustigma]|eukprot:GAX84702.1 hypothetical protein CEUSTIGMA_g12124.t1 [Chlamydomonas eustigma]